MVHGSGHASQEGMVPVTVGGQVRIEDISDSDSASESEDDEEGVVRGPIKSAGRGLY